MYCSHCNTPFEILPLADGKSRYCKNCGRLIYKKENNVIVIYHPNEIPEKQDEEAELRDRINREKEMRFRDQLERKQKELEFRTTSILDHFTTGQAWLCNEKSPGEAEFTPAGSLKGARFEIFPKHLIRSFDHNQSSKHFN